MGFFSLCHSAVEVSSGTSYVNLSPAVFLGKEQATVEKLPTPVHGTQIRFTRPSNKEAITAALCRVVEFYPVEVRLGGESLQRHDFLDGALYREIIDGIEVGFAPDFAWSFSPFHDDNWNFYGARIQQCELKISGVLLNDAPFPKALCARFNVLDTGRIKLQLPDRKAIIEDEFLQQFQQKARAAAYRFIHTLDRHVLPHKNWREALELGITLPEAACLLMTWHARAQDDCIDQFFGTSEVRLLSDTSQVIVVDRELPNQHTLEAALRCGAALEGELFMEEPQFQGYAWYDIRPRIVDVAVLLDGVLYEDWPEDARRPERIEVEITLTQSQGPERQVRINALIHADAERTIWDSSCFVAVNNSPWDNDQLSGPFSVIDFIINTTFCASDDCEADSWETQHDRYEEEVEREVNRYFRGPRATLLAILRGVIDYSAEQLADQIGVREIRFIRPEDNSRTWKVQLFDNNAESAAATTPSQLA